MARSTVCLVAGYGYTGKSLVCQAALLAAVNGIPVLGAYDVERRAGQPLRVLHLDYEQGEYQTARRYRSLAYGMGLDPDAATYPDAADLVSHPWPLTGKASEIARLCDGYDLVLIDSFRRAYPGIDENDSGEASTAFNALLSASRISRSCIVIIDHARKAAAGGRTGQDEMAIRGSGDKFGAVDVSWVLGRDVDDAPVTLRLRKDRLIGEPLAPLSVIMSQVPGDDSGHGLTIGVTPQRSQRELLVLSTVRDLVEANGGLPVSVRQVRQAAGDTATVRRAIERLIQVGEIVSTPGPRNSQLVMLCEEL